MTTPTGSGSGGGGGSGSAARRAQVRGWTTPRPVPGLPEELLLQQADDVIGLWERTEQGASGQGESGQGESGQGESGQGASGQGAPPFWAFPWAGGIGLALHLLGHPDVVRGRQVLDVAAGSGLIAVTAARLGAARVEAVDVDPLAVAACEVNAATNRVQVTARLADVLGGAACLGDGAPADVVLAGDVFYERDLAARSMGFLQRAARRGAVVLIGDPGRAHAPRHGLEAVARYVVPVPAQLEDGDTKAVTIWRPVPEPDTGRHDPGTNGNRA